MYGAPHGTPHSIHYLEVLVEKNFPVFLFFCHNSIELCCSGIEFLFGFDLDDLEFFIADLLVSINVYIVSAVFRFKSDILFIVQFECAKYIAVNCSVVIKFQSDDIFFLFFDVSEMLYQYNTRRRISQVGGKHLFF